MKTKFCFLLFWGLLMHQVTYASNDSLLINQLLKKIADNQVKDFDGTFYKGMFYSYRECGAWPVRNRPDNNIFFTAVSVFALKNMLPNLSVENQLIAQSVISNAKAAYPKFLNPKPNGLYEFWPTDNTFMPNSLWLKHTKSIFGQGEDVDDCVMILMTADHPDSIHQLFKQRITAVANLSIKQNNQTFKAYRNYPAYSTYLGKKMKVDFDCCVQANLLYYICQQNMPYAKQDSATVQLLAAHIKNKDYLNHPSYISPWYGSPSVIIYHLARLMGAYQIPELEKLKPILIADAQYLLTQPGNIMDKIILSTSLLRLGQKQVSPIPIKDLESFEKSRQDKFIFFQARGSAFMPNTMKRLLSNQGQAFYFNFYSPDYNKALLLEYLVERNKPVNKNATN